MNGAVLAAAGLGAGEAAWFAPRNEHATTPCGCEDRAPEGDPPERAHSALPMLVGGPTPTPLGALIAPFLEVTLMRIQC